MVDSSVRMWPAGCHALDGSAGRDHHLATSLDGRVYCRRCGLIQRGAAEERYPPKITKWPDHHPGHIWQGAPYEKNGFWFTVCTHCGPIRVSAPGTGSVSRRKARIIARLGERDGMRCAYCTRSFSEYLLPTIEHRIPISRGGAKKSTTNLCLACSPCNQLKSNMTEEEFRVVLVLSPTLEPSLRRIAS